MAAAQWGNFPKTTTSRDHFWPGPSAHRRLAMQRHHLHQEAALRHQSRGRCCSHEGRERNPTVPPAPLTHAAPTRADGAERSCSRTGPAPKSRHHGRIRPSLCPVLLTATPAGLLTGPRACGGLPAQLAKADPARPQWEQQTLPCTVSWRPGQQQAPHKEKRWPSTSVSCLRCGCSRTRDAAGGECQPS